MGHLSSSISFRGVCPLAAFALHPLTVLFFFSVYMCYFISVLDKALFRFAFSETDRTGALRFHYLSCAHHQVRTHIAAFFATVAILLTRFFLSQTQGNPEADSRKPSIRLRYRIMMTMTVCSDDERNRMKAFSNDLRLTKERKKLCLMEATI